MRTHVSARFIDSLLEKTDAVQVEIACRRNVEPKWSIMGFDRNYLQYKREGDTLDEAASKIVEAMTRK